MLQLGTVPNFIRHHSLTCRQVSLGQDEVSERSAKTAVSESFNTVAVVFLGPFPTIEYGNEYILQVRFNGACEGDSIGRPIYQVCEMSSYRCPHKVIQGMASPHSALQTLEQLYLRAREC